MFKVKAVYQPNIIGENYWMENIDAWLENDDFFTFKYFQFK